jgi:hypothetical protein
METLTLPLLPSGAETAPKPLVWNTRVLEGTIVDSHLAELPDCCDIWKTKTVDGLRFVRWLSGQDSA